MLSKTPMAAPPRRRCSPTPTPLQGPTRPRDPRHRSHRLCHQRPHRSRPASVIDDAGDLLAYCPGEPCTEVHVADLVTERTVIIGRREPFSPRSGRFSPDGTQLAIAIDSGVVLADTASGEVATIVDDITTDALPLSVAWPPMVVSSSRRPTGMARCTRLSSAKPGQRQRRCRHCAFGAGRNFVALAPSQVGTYLLDQDQEPADCPPTGGMPSDRPTTCGFGS